MNNILIDTDVILDFYLDRKPFAEKSTRIISLCESRVTMGYVTPVICSNLYYILRQTAGHEKVMDKLGKLLTVLDVLLMDRNSVLQAIDSGFKDYEDALQYCAASQSGKIDIIITWNIKDFQKSEISVLTPDDYLKIIEKE